MQYILLDESGDLGFDPQKRNSKYFIVTIIFASDIKPLHKLVKKVHGSLRKNVKRLSGGILHSYKEKPTTRMRLLKLLSNQECTIMVIHLNKSKVYSKLKDEKHILYNYVVNILLDRIITRNYIDKNKPITLIAAKRETNKFLNTNFKSYLQTQIKNNHSVSLNVEIKMPSEEKSLQVVDFASWAIFRKYEIGDEDYSKIIKRIIKEESGLFS